MAMTEKQWILLGVSLFSAALLLGLVLFFLSWHSKKQGLDGKKKVSRLLKGFAGIRSFRVLNDLTLAPKGKEVAIDHILIGFFGIILITNRNYPGNIYGSGRDKKWVRVVTKHEQEKRGSFPNPIAQGQAGVDAVREVLTASNIYKTSIESYVVFPHKKAVLNTEKGLPVLTLKDLKKLLKRKNIQRTGMWMSP